MPRHVVQSIDADVPTMDDLKTYFPHYVSYAEGAGRIIFDTVCTPLALELARSATRNGLPAVAGVADLCDHAQPGWIWTSFNKQFLGGVVRVLMSVNGHPPTGTKRNIPHQAFSRGEVYAAVP